jgi:hypothetical protein
MSLIFAKDLKRCRKKDDAAIPIALLKHSSKDKANDLIVCHSHNKSLGSTGIHIDPKEFTLYPIPYKSENQRICANIVGASGSGKSVFLARFIRASNKYDKSIEHNLLITASESEDPAFDIVIEGLSKKKQEQYEVRKIDMEYAPSELAIEQLANYNLIFDDYGFQKDAMTNKWLQHLQGQLLERSRKLNTNLYIINHDARNFNKTKLTLIESQTFVVFPQSNEDSARKLLKSYCFENKERLNYAMGIDNGPFTFLLYQRNPAYIMSQDRIELFKQSEFEHPNIIKIMTREGHGSDSDKEM